MPALSLSRRLPRSVPAELRESIGEESLQTLGWIARATWLRVLNIRDRSLGPSGLHRSGRVRVSETRSNQALIPFQFEQREGNGGSLRFSQPLRLWQPRKNAFPVPTQALRIPPETTNCAERSSSLYLLHSSPDFEILLVQYYNLKTSIICSILKRKIQTPPLAILQGSSLSRKPKAVSTQVKLSRELKRGVSEIPLETLDPTPLGSILPLLCWDALEGTFPLSHSWLGPANQGQPPCQRSTLSQALGYLL